MTFTRSNPFGWYKTDVLTSDQINQMDDNISHAVDIRDGYTNYVESQVIVSDTGSMTFETGCQILIEDPTNMLIGPGTMRLDCEVLGYSAPLRFGYATTAVTSILYTVPEATYIRYIIQLTGALSGNTAVILPTLAGYSKLISNDCTGAYTLTVKTALGTGVTIPNGKKALVYCDGTNIVEGPKTESNTTYSIFHLNEASGYGTAFQTISASSPIFLSGYERVFYNVLIGDMFEISYTVGMVSSDAPGIVYTQVTCSDAPFTQYDTITSVTGLTQKVNSVSTVYTAVANGTLAISLASNVNTSIYPGYVKTPLSFTVKYIKP